MATRTNGVAINHGDIAAIDGAAALSFVGTFRRLSAGSIPGVTKGNLFLLYSPDADDLAGGESAVWQYASTDNAIATDVDYRIACVYDGSLSAADRYKLWVDGVAKSLSGSTPGATLPSSASPLETGKTTTSAVDGVIADFKMWSVALTAAEIIQETHSWRPARKSGLFIWSPYSGPTDLVDYSGSGNHGSNASATRAQNRPLSYGTSVAVL